jgi:hypothetical protein
MHLYRLQIKCNLKKKHLHGVPPIDSPMGRAVARSRNGYVSLNESICLRVLNEKGLGRKLCGLFQGTIPDFG